MRYLSFITEHCKQTAKTHSLVNEIQKLAIKVEKDQSVQAWDFFLPTPFIKKDLGKSFRLVCSKHHIEDDDIIIIAFLSCFPRGGNGEYEKFIANPELICGRYLPSDKGLRSFLVSRREPLPEPYPELSEPERQYLYATIEQEQGTDIMVHESMDWVNSMKNPKILEESTRLYDSLSDLLNSSEISSFGIYKNERSNISIYYKYLSQFNIVFLVAPLLTEDEDCIDELKQKYEDINEDASCSKDIILKKSRRSYPSYVLADEKLWKSIQRDDVGNIALSPEETDILNDVTSGVSDKLFPLFINGRPGSGKSTILQYLFASHIYIYLNQNDDLKFQYPPLYLTYSENLLESAKQNIKAILKCNSNLASSINPKSILRFFQNNNCFGVFHTFLLNLLSEETKKNFLKDKKIDFTTFRTLWNNKRKGNPQNEIRKLSSELAWHVIRSYIKGMRYDSAGEFTINSYQELPTNQQTVEIDTFKRIYHHVWLSWYKQFCEENGSWDDQDLVYAVLNEPDLKLSNYPAVFCDESQDFSKLELDLILRLSLYSQRTVSPNELKRVPFAFAGDPFQTLNPTGFEWESLQANFHEKIVSGLDKSSIGKLEFNYQELSYNYRSGKFIVGLCNLFQLLRGILFDQKGIMPQQTWFDSEASMPILFNVNDPICEKNLRDQTELVIILPCQEGEEEEFVNQDAFLNKLTESEINIRNFLSPMRAKGLEFSRVVLYKFGSACFKNYPNLFMPLATGEQHSKNIDTSLPLKYFMNRLYVGASRAKFRLILVDDDNGIETLWNNTVIKEFDALFKMYANSRKLGWNSSVINYVQKGIEDNWTQNRDDPLSLAKEFHSYGKSEKDPYKMRLAEANYNRCEQPANAKLCKAERYEMESRLSKAGELYLEISKNKEALNCYWKAGEFEIVANNRNFSNTAKQRAASFYEGNHSEVESEHFLSFLLEQLNLPDSYKITWDDQWKRIFDNCLSSIIQFPRGANFDKLYLLIREIEKKRLKPSDSSNYAELAYLAKEYEHALTLWEDSSSVSRNTLPNYCEAKAYVLSFPSNLEWLKKGKNHQKIIQEWGKNKKEPLNDDHVSIIAKSLLKLNDLDNAVSFLEDHPNEKCLLEAYQKLKKATSQKNQEMIGQLLIAKYAEIGKWKEIVELINDKKLGKSILKSFSKILAYEVVQAKEFRQTTNENKNVVAKLLKKLFIDAPWENVVPMRVVGAAIENAYKIIDALEFYEGVWKKKKIRVEKEDRDYAIARWVKSKLRLAEFLDKEGKRKGAGKHRSEAENVCSNHLGINKDRIPDMPEFDVDELLHKDDIPKVSAITVSKMTQEGVLALHKTGWDSKSIAESFKIELEIVHQIIQD